MTSFIDKHLDATYVCQGIITDSTETNIKCTNSNIKCSTEQNEQSCSKINHLFTASFGGLKMIVFCNNYELLNMITKEKFRETKTEFRFPKKDDSIILAIKLSI